MNNQQAINLLKDLEKSLDDYCELNEEGKTAFRMAIKALNCSEIPNNSDTISRQAVTKFLNDWLSCLFENCHKQSASDLKMIIKDFKNLPSAKPVHKTGRWIELTCDSAEWWYCSECNGRVQMNPWAKYNYCPNCGANMRSEQNE